MMLSSKHVVVAFTALMMAVLAPPHTSAVSTRTYRLRHVPTPLTHTGRFEYVVAKVKDGILLRDESPDILQHRSIRVTKSASTKSTKSTKASMGATSKDAPPSREDYSNERKPFTSPTQSPKEQPLKSQKSSKSLKSTKSGSSKKEPIQKSKSSKASNKAPRTSKKSKLRSSPSNTPAIVDPSSSPSMSSPSSISSATPSKIPSSAPSDAPIMAQGDIPLSMPSDVPSSVTSAVPSSSSFSPSDTPSWAPSSIPSNIPSPVPSDVPSSSSFSPSDTPSWAPSSIPSNMETSSPTIGVLGLNNITDSGANDRRPSTESSSVAVLVSGTVVGLAAVLSAGLIFYYRKTHASIETDF